MSHTHKALSSMLESHYLATVMATRVCFVRTQTPGNSRAIFIRALVVDTPPGPAFPDDWVQFRCAIGYDINSL